jgi:glycosyltransferase involved in cell wall biosynthesis
VVVFVNHSFDLRERDAEALVTRDLSVSAWARAVIKAGGGPVAVVQRFWTDRAFAAGGVEYRFVSDGPWPEMPWHHLGEATARAVRSLDPTVVHLHGMVHPWHTRFVRLQLPRHVPVLVQDHGGIHAGSALFSRRFWRIVYRVGLGAADGFLFSAAELAAPWQRASIIRPGQAVYEIMESSTDIADGAQPDTSGPRAIGSPALLWVGRLNGNKDPLTVLDGFEQAIPAIPDAVLNMAFASGELLPEVRGRIARSAALRPRVRLLGKVARSAMPGLYISADMFVLGSYHEGSGYAVIEALACGTTPCVTDIPSFRRLTERGRLGALFPPGDSIALGKAMRRLAGRDLRAQREVVRAHFSRSLSWPMLGRAAVAIYRAAIERRRFETAPVDAERQRCRVS